MWSWVSGSIYGPEHEMVLGKPYLFDWLWLLSASASKCEKATFKEAEQGVISVSLYSPFRSPLWWPYSCWLRSVTTTSSMPRSTNVPCPWTSSVPYPGVCSCLVIHMTETEFFKGIDLLYFLFFHWECVCCGFYLPGRWILILSSTCMTSCEPAVNKDDSDSKTEANIRQNEEAIVENFVEEN